MANSSPWSVKGVAPEAREAAKIAARRQGVNVGRWLTQTILAAASEELRSKRGDSVRPDSGGGSQSFTFTGQPAGQSQGSAPQNPQQAAPPPPQHPQQHAQPHPGAPPPPPQNAHPQYEQQAQPAQQQPNAGPPALTPEAVLASIQKLAQRIEESEQRTSEVLKPIADRVGDLSQQINEIKDKSGGSTAPVERAMMRLSERLDRMEESGGGARRPSKPSSSSSSSNNGVIGRLFGRD